MKILAKIPEIPSRYALITTNSEATDRNLKRLINSQKYERAIMEALKHGSHIVIDLNENEALEHSAELILTPGSAHWDLAHR